MSVVEKPELADVVPTEWRDQYHDVVLTSGRDGHDYLYGVDEQGHKSKRLSWEPLDRSIQEAYGIEWAAPYPALHAENAELKLQNQKLISDMETLGHEMAAMEERFNRKIADLEARLEETSRPPDLGNFERVRRWTPRSGDEILVPTGPGEPDNVLTIESIDKTEKAARVRNSDGQRVGMPLSQLAHYWYVQQIERKREIQAATQGDDLQSRMQRAYNRLLGKRTQTEPAVIINDKGESVVLLEEEDVADKRAVAVAAVAAGLLVAGLVGYMGYEIGKDNAPTTTKTTTVIKSVAKPLPSNSIVIGKDRYRVLLNDEKALAAARSSNARLKERIHDLRANSGSSDRSATGAASLGYSGDTVWHEVSKRVREKLGYHATIPKIRKATDYVLRLNGLRWNGGGYGVDAHYLPVGLHFKIPENIASIANK